MQIAMTLTYTSPILISDVAILDGEFDFVL